MTWSDLTFMLNECIRRFLFLTKKQPDLASTYQPSSGSYKRSFLLEARLELYLSTFKWMNTDILALSNGMVRSGIHVE